MRNAKEEFIARTQGYKVIAADIREGNSWHNWQKKRKREGILKQGYNEKEYQDFIKSLDFWYDDGYGSQQLFGTIWCEDGVWFDRGEYDGSEWREKHEYPKITV